MTVAELWSPPETEGGVHDVVSGRVLVGIQMVDIARLSTHPVPVISEGLITVAGQGPKDSNGAGKSSFIAALSLLHADEQWRLTSGAASAAELLFTAELAAQETRWSNADRGYIIGVYAAPGAKTIEELRSSVLTVWLRINRKAPYLDLRWIYDLHVPVGSNDDERARQVDPLWQALPRSNGRTDFHANRLGTVLYGGHVRCVSFLSTSVRASPTANLLAQPLNELTPDRVFDAIATLTGLDRELLHEQELRSTEHTHRAAAVEAADTLEQWDRDMALVEAGIKHRARAREQLGTARAAWHSRCARYLLDGVERDQQIRDALKALGEEMSVVEESCDSLEGDLRILKDDNEFADRFNQRKQLRAALVNRDRELEREHDRTIGRVDDLNKQLIDLRARAQAADGRTLAQAQDEEAEAQAEWKQALGDQAIAEDGVKVANRGVAEAEAGDDVASEQMRRLREAGIPAVALLDVVVLSEAERTVWENRLMPYRTALIIEPERAGSAAAVLHDLPGSMIVLAGSSSVPAVSVPGSSGLPVSADPRFPLSGFLTALADRSGDDDQQVDVTAGVVVIGDFPDPITGRVARIAAAQAGVAASEAGLKVAESGLAVAARLLERARERSEAAAAADRVVGLQQQVEEMRLQNDEHDRMRQDLQPELTEAEAEFVKALTEQGTREQTIRTLTDEIRRLRTSLQDRADQREGLAAELQGLELAARQKAWGETADAATTYLLSLGGTEQKRTVGDWNEEACHQLNEVVRLCFPDDTPRDHLPREIGELLHQQRWFRGGLEIRTPLVPAMLRALNTHLANTERQDRDDQQSIEKQRGERTKGLAAAQQGLAEAAHAALVTRASLATGIKDKLKKVAAEFDRLDQQYGGYGAGLEYPEPEPPTQPDKPWRWTVTPKWRRAEGQRMASYSLRANTAQIDEKAVKLVCAAALAGSGNRPLLLVLDELGRNLGSEHRREAVALFERIGADRNITVVGALQDDMERYAISASGLYIKLRRSSDAMPYNEAPVVNGSEPNHARVELLRDWMSSYRPASEDGVGAERAGLSSGVDVQETLD
jgi:chromosome segregation protein